MYTYNFIRHTRVLSILFYHRQKKMSTAKQHICSFGNIGTRSAFMYRRRHLTSAFGTLVQRPRSASPFSPLIRCSYSVPSFGILIRYSDSVLASDILTLRSHFARSLPSLNSFASNLKSAACPSVNPSIQMLSLSSRPSR